MLLYIFIFPDRAKAEQITVYYLNDDNVYASMLSQTFEIKNTYNTAEKTFIILDKLFNNVQNINYVPKNAKVLNVEKIGEKVYVNISGEILGYGGGSTYEIGLVRQLLYNIFQFDETETVSIFIENKKCYFPEGTLIYNYKKSDFLTLPKN